MRGVLIETMEKPTCIDSDEDFDDIWPVEFDELSDTLCRADEKKKLKAKLAKQSKQLMR